MLHDYGSIALLMLAAFIFPFIPLFISAHIQTKKPSAEKLSTYECGVDTIGKTWVQFKSSYFLYALVFVVFDIETVFLYPWAVKFRMMGTYAFVEMLVFVAILVLGLWYAWKKGALEWQ